MRPAVAEIPPSQVSGRAPGLGTRQLWEAVRGSLGLGSCKENSMGVGCCVPGYGVGSRSVSKGGGWGPLTHAILEG